MINTARKPLTNRYHIHQAGNSGGFSFCMSIGITGLY
jgi:hypothetical protein